MKKFKEFLIEKGRRDFWEMLVDGKVFDILLYVYCV
jgi:hypothetical protein